MAVWGILWRRKNKDDGIRDHLIYEDRIPKLFVTRTAAKAFIDEKYGYLRNRPDLRAEPFGYRMPKPVRVAIAIESE